jgi:Family of unknown function (DUF6515)
MKTTKNNIAWFAFLAATVALVSIVFSTDVYAQRMRVAQERQAPARFLRMPPNHVKVYAGNRPYYYHNGYFYRGWRGSYVLFHPPFGARFRFLPYGFWSFHIGPALYFYGGGAYFQYLPDENAYVVVPKPNQAPASPSSDEDVMNLTDGSTLSGVFVGATADSVQFQVKNEVHSVPITQVKSINFAPSSFKEQK